jgi:hypothetical protein
MPVISMAMGGITIDNEFDCIRREWFKKIILLLYFCYLKDLSAGLNSLLTKGIG